MNLHKKYLILARMLKKEYPKDSLSVSAGKAFNSGYLSSIEYHLVLSKINIASVEKTHLDKYGMKQKASGKIMPKGSVKNKRKAR